MAIPAIPTQISKSRQNNENITNFQKDSINYSMQHPEKDRYSIHGIIRLRSWLSKRRSARGLQLLQRLLRTAVILEGGSADKLLFVQGYKKPARSWCSFSIVKAVSVASFQLPGTACNTLLSFTFSSLDPRPFVFVFRFDGESAIVLSSRATLSSHA